VSLSFACTVIQSVSNCDAMFVAFLFPLSSIVWLGQGMPLSHTRKAVMVRPLQQSTSAPPLPPVAFMSFRCFHVLPLLSCPPVAFMSFRWFHVLPLLSCPPVAFMSSRCFHVLPLLSCPSVAFMSFRCFHVLPLLSGPPVAFMSFCLPSFVSTACAVCCPR